MDLENEYKKETGLQTHYLAGDTHVYYKKYVKWLEQKLIASLEQLRKESIKNR